VSEFPSPSAYTLLHLSFAGGKHFDPFQDEQGRGLSFEEFRTSLKKTFTKRERENHSNAVQKQNFGDFLEDMA
jgi:hypothetical protein